MLKSDQSYPQRFHSLSYLDEAMSTLGHNVLYVLYDSHGLATAQAYFTSRKEKESSNHMCLNI